MSLVVVITVTILSSGGLEPSSGESLVYIREAARRAIESPRTITLPSSLFYC